MTGRFDSIPPVTRGIAAIVMAMLLFAVMDSCAKALLERYPTTQVVWARFASQTFLISVIFLPSLWRRMQSANLPVQVLRSVFHLAATASFFLALNFMPLAEAVAVFEVSPLLITILAALVLREHVGPRRWAGVVIGLMGALVIIRPGLDVFQPAALLPLLAASCMAGFQISTRFLGGADSIWTTMIWSGGVGFVVTSAVVPFYWVTPTLADAALMATFGWIGFLGHTCLVYALAQAPASVLAPYNYVGFIWASLLAFLIFGEVPDSVTLLGAGIIIGAGVYVWYRERVRALSDR